MDMPSLTTQAEAYFAENAANSQEFVTPLPRLALLRHRHPTELSASLYEPVVCLILQGAKETRLGDTGVEVGPGQSLVVSHDLPVVSRITRARPDEPYLALIVSLDLVLLRSLHDKVGDARAEATPPRSLAAHDTEPALVDCLSRYLAIAGDPVEERVMGPLLLEEIHFRLLMAPHGGMLRELLRNDSHASAVMRAIARIRRDFRTSLKVPELAREVGMSASSFHKHFREITSTTPLQYQKELRLLEAQRLLATGAQSVSDVAYDVGYESPNQFSREYSRKFGTSPRDEQQRATQ